MGKKGTKLDKHGIRIMDKDENLSGIMSGKKSGKPASKAGDSFKDPETESGDPYEIKDSKLSQEEINELYSKAEDFEEGKNDNPDYDISGLKIDGADKEDFYKKYGPSGRNIYGKKLFSSNSEEGWIVLQGFSEKEGMPIISLSGKDKKISLEDLERLLEKYVRDEEAGKKDKDDIFVGKDKEKNILSQKEYDKLQEESGTIAYGKKKGAYNNDSTPEDVREYKFRNENLEEIKREKLLELYKKDAQEMLEFIKNIDYEKEYGCDKADIENIIEAQTGKFWNKFKDEMLSEKRFSNDKEAEKAFQEIKASLEK